MNRFTIIIFAAMFIFSLMAICNIQKDKSKNRHHYGVELVTSIYFIP